VGKLAAGANACAVNQQPNGAYCVAALRENAGMQLRAAIGNLGM
jgi:hypothetical protein